MKKIMIVAGILICSCTSSQKNDSTGDSSDAGGSFQLLEKTANDPFVHWELMSDRAEDLIGKEPYIYVLPASYQTDGTAAICVANVQHSADVANGSPDTNHVGFPYVRYRPYSANDKRYNVWVYISKRNIPAQTASINAWMLKTARDYHGTGLIVDSSENVAALYKLKWHSVALQ